MQRDFEGELFWSDASLTSRIFFVDEFDGKDLFRCVWNDCFLDAEGELEVFYV